MPQEGFESTPLWKIPKNYFFFCLWPSGLVLRCMRFRKGFWSKSSGQYPCSRTCWELSSRFWRRMRHWINDCDCGTKSGPHHHDCNTLPASRVSSTYCQSCPGSNRFFQPKILSSRHDKASQHTQRRKSKASTLNYTLPAWPCHWAISLLTSWVIEAGFHQKIHKTITNGIARTEHSLTSSKLEAQRN